jgi:peroxiredoxin
LARVKVASIPEAGQQAPEFHLPSAQGGQLRLSTRTVRGPVVGIFYRPWSEEDVEYFSELARKEEDINLAAATLVGIGVAEPEGAKELVAESGINSYVLYDYSQEATREWGLLEKDKDHGEHSRPAVFIVGLDNEILHAWVDERPSVEEIYARIHEITGLPKPPEEEEEEKPKKKSANQKESSGGGEESGAEETSEKSGEQGSAPEGQQESSGEKAEEEQKSGAEASSEDADSGHREASEGSSEGETQGDTGGEKRE